MATSGMGDFRENLLGCPFLNDLGDLRLGRGVCIIFPGPFPGCQESGVYARKIEPRVKGNDLRVVPFLWGNGILVQFAPSGESYPLVGWSEILALEAV